MGNLLKMAVSKGVDSNFFFFLFSRDENWRAMMGPGGLISDSGFSDWAGGYSERSSKRPRLTEPNYYFSVSGNNPLRGTEEAYDMPPAANRSEQVRIFGSNLNVMGSTFYRPSHAGGILGGESTSGLHNFPVVRLRGLPFDCQDRDIYSFFVGLDVVDCLCVNKNGRFTGEAYVVFPNRMQVQLSLQWDHQNMGHRYVEVFLCKKRDYYNAVASEVTFFVFFVFFLLDIYVSHYFSWLVCYFTLFCKL